jgi:H+/gluconate symporter-like permease
MNNKQQLKKHLSKSLHTDKKSLIIGSIIATILAITPYLFTIYESVPHVKVWDTFLFTYDSKSWEDANLFFWILSSKAIPLLLLIIWFFTNRHWWYHALLVPIIMYIYQIFGLFNEDQGYIDELQIIYMVPIMAIVIPSIYLIRARIFNRINEANKTMEELEEELKISPKNFWGKIKDYF